MSRRDGSGSSIPFRSAAGRGQWSGSTKQNLNDIDPFHTVEAQMPCLWLDLVGEQYISVGEYSVRIQMVDRLTTKSTDVLGGLNLSSDTEYERIRESTCKLPDSSATSITVI